MMYCMENIGYKEKEQKLLSFYEEYIQKYIIEITDFNQDIKVNNSDNALFHNIMEVVNNPGMYLEDSEVEFRKMLDMYDAKDGLANFLTFGLLKVKDGYFYIDAKKLAKKALDHKKVEELSEVYDGKVISIGSKK